MIKIRFLIHAVIIATLSLSAIVYGQQKLAQTGMQFINVPTDARAEAMGETVTSLDGNSSSMFFNPAGMARMGSFTDVSVGMVNWIAGINHTYGSIAFSPSSGDYGVFGITFHSVNYGELQQTILATNSQGFLDVGTFSPSAYSVGVGYANALSDKFAVGGDISYVYQDLGSSITNYDANGNYVYTKERKGVPCFDFGMIYRTGFKSFAFGMDIRSFSRQLKYEEESFDLPLIFHLGISMNVLDLWNMDSKVQSLIVAADATHPRDYPEQVNVGLEYTFMQMFSLRGGYMFNNDEYGITGGVGVQKQFDNLTIGLDYAYTPFGILGNVQRLAFHISY
jgi:hypothetical protein